MKKILISGATGLVGKKLSKKLKERGYKVEILVRKGEKSKDYKSYEWDYEKKFLEKGALDQTYSFIHLAGAPISKRWTKEYKKQIYNSRVNSSQFIYEEMCKQNVFPESVISSSAVGYYGQITTNHVFTEEDLPNNDFLGTVCKNWELKAKQFKNLGSREIRVRTAAVLADDEGFLETFVKPIHYNVGAVLGNGQQFVPWIHFEDLINIYVQAVEDVGMSGAYNAVAPEFVTNKILTYKIAKILNKKILFPNIPKGLVGFLLGEMSSLALEGSRISPQKILDTGFRFNYDMLDKAIDDLLG